jgi:hypothetical protein
VSTVADSGRTHSPGGIPAFEKALLVQYLLRLSLLRLLLLWLGAVAVSSVDELLPVLLRDK